MIERDYLRLVVENKDQLRKDCIDLCWSSLESAVELTSRHPEDNLRKKVLGDLNQLSDFISAKVDPTDVVINGPRIVIPEDLKKERKRSPMFEDEHKAITITLHGEGLKSFYFEVSYYEEDSLPKILPGDLVGIRIKSTMDLVQCPSIELDFNLQIGQAISADYLKLKNVKAEEFYPAILRRDDPKKLGELTESFLDKFNKILKIST